MQRLLLRAAVLIGTSTAGVVIALGISEAAHADDRPDPIGGVTDAVTDVVDLVLPKPEPREPEPESEPDNDLPSPARPVRDIADTVVDTVEQITAGTPVEPITDTVAEVVDQVVATPGQASAPQPAPDPLPLPPVIPAVALVVAAGPGADLTAPSLAVGPGPPSDCGAWRGQARSEPVHHYATGTVGGDVSSDRPADTPAAPGHHPPQPPDGGPNHELAATGASGHGAGNHLDAILADRASPHRTTVAPVPGDHRSGTGRTSRPVAPSG